MDIARQDHVAIARETDLTDQCTAMPRQREPFSSTAI